MRAALIFLAIEAGKWLLGAGKRALIRKAPGVKFW